MKQLNEKTQTTDNAKEQENPLQLWSTYSDSQLKEVMALGEEYKEFLTYGKTERLCVSKTIEMATEKGYKPLEHYIASGNIKTGDKFYSSFMNKAIILGIVGEEPFENGFNILGAHIDSPRLDLKQKPLYDSDGLCLLDTHYYGGIKKYQWVTLPLALHGVVAKKDGSILNISIGDHEDDPVFCVTDLLVHLSSKQLTKNGATVVEGEDLDLLFGSMCSKEQASVKEYILALLKEKYNFEEDDFLSAELEIVPAGAARDCGIDRSMVLGYGQDDRICAFASLKALLEQDKVERNCLCVLVDKEEIGSVGATGMESRFFENTLAELIYLQNKDGYNDLMLRHALARSYMLSSDVSAGFDPNYGSVFEKRNSAFLGKGVVFNKYTGARGKSGSNDANAEYMAKIRNIMDSHNVAFQTAELGKVDAGGGGTIAYILGNLCMNVIDCGIALLSMHAPWEVSSKADLYEGYKCYKAFLTIK